MTLTSSTAVLCRSTSILIL